METTLHAIYENVSLAQQAAQQLMLAGIDQRAIELISASARSVAMPDHVGGYAESGAHEHDDERDHVGGYADSGQHQHDDERDHVGGYADSGAHEHGGERDRVGSFASAAPARKPTPSLADTLQAGGLSAEDALAYAERLNAGAAALLVHVGADRAAQVAQMLRGA
jgi:hypothetical protein